MPRMPWVYTLAYRFDSNAFAHPTPLAIGRYLEERGEGFAVLSAPTGSVVDPYFVAARLFGALVEIAGTFDSVDHSELEPGLREIVAELDRMAAEIGAKG